uniref:Uncharacterized protein n=1 Tax=Setaria viridis TaxID=4556 RepID=A0A4U6U0T9_SETVI|nr:hypothetical protein SEVIR_7G320201v2 [Setaria viridis]
MRPARWSWGPAPAPPASAPRSSWRGRRRRSCHEAVRQHAELVRDPGDGGDAAEVGGAGAAHRRGRPGMGDPPRIWTCPTVVGVHIKDSFRHLPRIRHCFLLRWTVHNYVLMLYILHNIEFKYS